MMACLAEMPKDPVDFIISKLRAQAKPKVIFVMGGPGAGKGT